MILSLRRVVAWALVIGGLSFAPGFFGPMILAPDANQGPLLGILITGPLGLVLGVLVGVGRELFGQTAGPLEVLSRVAVGGRTQVDLARLLAAAGGVVLGLYGLAGLRRGEGRPAAASVVVAAVLLSYAVQGRFPAWFRR